MYGMHEAVWVTLSVSFHLPRRAMWWSICPPFWTRTSDVALLSMSHLRSSELFLNCSLQHRHSPSQTQLN
jgi:hypothetical protein